jgi:hypothetical protein
MPGSDLIQRIGHDEMRSIVAGILCGENVRAVTEPLTRRRISILNAALLITIAKASQFFSPHELLDAARSEFHVLSGSDPRRSVLMWILGLTSKQIDNVLRSNDIAWANFVTSAKSVSAESAEYSETTFGDLRWTIEIDNLTVAWNWLWAHSLMIPVGSLALGIRGSEKSIYGKFFEKMVLGSVLEILGFSFDPSRSGSPMTYWLNERGEKRESDATAIVSEGEGARFDLGFIGKGNTEISLDKVSRFARIDEIAGSQYEMATIIIVDRIGSKSRIIELADEIDGIILQMSSALWAKDLDNALGERFEQYTRIFQPTAQAKDIREAVFDKLSESDLEQLLIEAISE